MAENHSDDEKVSHRALPSPAVEMAPLTEAAKTVAHAEEVGVCSGKIRLVVMRQTLAVARLALSQAAELAALRGRVAEAERMLAARDRDLASEVRVNVLLYDDLEAASAEAARLRDAANALGSAWVADVRSPGLRHSNLGSAILNVIETASLTPSPPEEGRGRG